MRLFHISDLHIGIRLFNRDLAADQEHAFSQIIDALSRERPDALVIAGDLFDRAVPSAEAVEQFNRLITHLHEAAPDCALLAIAGNHDSAARIDLFRDIVSEQGIHLVGTPPRSPEEPVACVELSDEHGPVAFHLLPFVRPSQVRAALEVPEGEPLGYDAAVRGLLDRIDRSDGRRHVLVSHQFFLPAGTDADEVERMDSETRTVGNIDSIGADALSGFAYVALGHIHKPMTVGEQRIRYCGTPFPYSVSEAGQAKAILDVRIDRKGAVRIDRIPLSPLHEVRALRGTLEEVLGQGSSDYVSVLLTDEDDLDVADMQDRLRAAFPNLLEIRREAAFAPELDEGFPPERMPDPLELCEAFLGGLDDEERALLEEAFEAAGKEE